MCVHLVCVCAYLYLHTCTRPTHTARPDAQARLPGRECVAGVRMYVCVFMHVYVCRSSHFDSPSTYAVADIDTRSFVPSATIPQATRCIAPSATEVQVFAAVIRGSFQGCLVCVRVCVCVGLNALVPAQAHTHTHMHINTHTRTHINTRTHVHTHKHTGADPTCCAMSTVITTLNVCSCQVLIEFTHVRL